jgi:DNA polymerase-3 subunit alpha
MFKDFQPLNKPLLAGVRLPKISIESQFYEELGVPPSISNYEFLRRLCWKGIQEKCIDKLDNAKVYYERVKLELGVLKELGFDDYILLNWDILKFCYTNKIPTGDGRGSAAGCLIAYLLGVTKVDPLKHGLFFERFVSKSRARKIIDDDGTVYLDGSLVPDIDNDIDYSRRHEVIKFIEERHVGRTCKILTLNTLSGKLCIKEALKIVDGVGEDIANAVSNSIPKKFGKVLDFEDAIKESELFASYIKQYHRSYKVALKLEGLIKNTGVHPSGIAICHDQLNDTMPHGKTKDGDLISGFEMNDVASVAVKFDILGLRTLTVLDNVYKAVGINSEDICLGDKEVFDFLQNLIAPQGLFQIETDTGFRVCQKVKPKNIYDLSAVLAIARPGALAFADQYAKFSNTGEYQSIHPYFDDVLKFTGGIPLYQEQLISCARKIGFTADEGEQLRRIVGKKKADQMKEWKSKIENKIKENNLETAIGDVLWKIAEDSAGYSFNYSHSLAYATCSFRTIYCKVHHTKEFFLALLKMAQNEPDPLTEIFKISQELALFNIKLLPPDLSKSKEEFSIEGKDLRYGLNSIKGVSEKSIKNLLDFRGHEFTNKYQVFQSAKDCGLNIGILCTLIQAGCLESFGENRCKLVLEAQMFNKLTEKEKFAVQEVGEYNNYDIFAALKDGADGKILNAKNKSAFTEKRIQKLREEHGKYKQIYDQNIKHQKFCNWYFEREMLGYSYSYTLRDVFEEPKNTFTPILEFNSLDDNDTVRIVGVVTEVKKTTSKKGNKYMMLDISDDGGKLSGMFGDNAKDNKWSRHLEEKLPVPEEDSVVTVVGKKFGDLLMIDKFSIVDEKIFTKLSQIK